MKKILFTILFLTLVSTAYTQWISNFSSINDVNFASAKGNSVVCDAYGNSYVTGYSYEGLTNGNDIMTVKYDENGNVIWAENYNGTAVVAPNDEGRAVCVDNEGNVYIVGNTQNLLTLTDIVIIKYNSAGVFQWREVYNSGQIAATDNGNAIAVDANGFIYVTGFTTQADGKMDIYTAKYSSSGSLIWGKTEHGSYGLNSEGLGITVSASGNVFVCGYISNPNTGNDITVLRYDSEGNSTMNKQISGTTGNGEDKAWGIVVDTDENIFITGYVTISYNNTDCFTAKINPEGNTVWNKTYNGQGGQVDKAWGIVIDTDGCIFTTGESRNTYNTDYVTIKYDIDGQPLWITNYNGTGNGTDQAANLVIVNNGTSKSIVVTGKSWGSSGNYDYATVRYNFETGTQVAVNRYSYSGFSNDVAKDIAVSILNKVCITGFSQLLIETPHNGPGTSYSTTMMIDINTEMISEISTPEKYSLMQNYPNPFNPSTTIKFELPNAGAVKITVYDMLGKVVNVLVNQNLDAGSHEITFSAANLSSGIYFYELQTGSFRDIKKMTLVK